VLSLGYVLLFVPAGGAVLVARGPLLVYAALILAASAAVAAGMFYLLRPRRASGPRLEVLAAGLEAGDHDLIQRLFPNSQEVRLVPLSGGYSGATVLRAQSWGAGATLQRSSVVKVGSAAKLQPEVENFERYVREYVGNTATLLHTTQRGGRMALRWAYAAFLGEQVQTLADYAASGAPLAPVIDELFASRSTLGLLLGTPRRDTGFALYREYSWTPRDWRRIVAAAAEVLDGAPLRPDLPFATLVIGAEDRRHTNPLPIVEGWCNSETGHGARADQLFDVPIATIHGDLNSRNVLLDERGSIFVIDFAQSGPGHLLRDFARLETELLLVLDQPQSAAATAERVGEARALLVNTDGTPCRTLRDVLGAPAFPGQRGAAIGALRRHAHDLAGPWLNTPATSYLLALLHTTLDTLRYAQCGVQTRRAALLIAGELCRLLE
jgi:hypothetical protein